MIIPSNRAPILSVATNLGGSNNIIPVSQYAVTHGHQVSVAASEITLNQFRLNSFEPLQLFEPTVEPTECNFDLLRFGAFLLGTTRFPGPENFFMQAAVAHRIPVTVVVDERYRFLDRFRLTKGGHCFPSAICVIDEYSRDLAIEEGVPEGIIHVTGSPAIENISRKITKSLTNESLRWPGDSEPRTRILFVSESHSEDYGESFDSPGRHGEYLGYTELDVRKDIFKAINDLLGRFSVIEKLHPDSSKVPEPLENEKVKWNVVKTDQSIHQFIQKADIVIGMRSFALLEAAVVGATTISYQPNLVGRNNCAAANLDFVKTALNLSDLKELISDAFKKESTSSIANNMCSFSVGSTERVFKTVLRSI